MVTMQASARPTSCAIALAIYAVFATLWPPITPASQSDDTTATKPSGLPQVTVTAPREVERRRLDRVLIPHFIRSHGALAATTNQLARWDPALCPETLGLSAAFNAFVSRRIKEVATSVGAAVDRNARCAPNVQIFFETQPQKQCKKVAGYTIGSISDYIAMLVLAQVASLDKCDELPSITDLMASKCDQRQKAEASTAGDIAYLKGLCSANLEMTSTLQRSPTSTLE